jgi:hypothetical protein
MKFSKIYLEKLNTKNNFYIYIKIFITLAIGLGIILFILLALNILNIEININIVNISSIGILVAVLLTISNNFYLKEEEEFNNKKKSKLIITYTLEKMTRICQNELRRIENQESYLNALLHKKSEEFHNFYFEAIKENLEVNLKILLENIKYLDELNLLSEFELELVKLQPSKFKEQTELIKHYHNNKESLQIIKNKLNELLKMNLA